jgi:hypothetical protein
MICRRVAAALGGLFLLGADVHAQSTVLLRMAPRVGDTLHLRLEQQMEMRGRTRDGVDTARAMTTNLRVFARVVPIRVAGGATTVTTITDSLLVGTGEQSRQLDQARLALQGRRTDVRIMPDGAMEVVDPAEHDDAASPLFGNMPAVLPRGVVSVGARWTREMPLPMRGSRGTPAVVRATFRLDSLSRDNRVAFISVRGAFYERPQGVRGPERELEGSLTGALEFDRELGWVMDSHTTITMRSDARPPDIRAAPMEVWMRITQRLQARSTR